MTRDDDGLAPSESTVDLMRAILATLPDDGYRSVSTSYSAPALGGAIVTITVSVGEPDDQDDEP